MTKVEVLVPVSGGKDSQACLKLAVEAYGAASVRGLFCDTRHEHPLTYEHVEKLRRLYGVRIDVVCAGSVEEKVLKYGRFPGGGCRFCTEELKIIPTKKYCKALAESQGGFEVWYGMRSEESPARRKRYTGKISEELYAPHEVLPGKYPKYLSKLGVFFRLAVIHWTEREIFSYLAGQHHPLYDEDFDRVGCFPCYASGDKPKEKAFSHDQFGQQQYVKTIWLSQQIGKSIWTSKGGKARNEGYSGCALGVCE